MVCLLAALHCTALVQSLDGRWPPHYVLLCRYVTLIDRNFKGLSAAHYNLQVVSRLDTTCNEQPRAGSGVVRIDLLRFLAGCRTMRLNQV